MPFVTDIVEGRARLVLSGEVTIVEAAALHAALTRLASTAAEVVVEDSCVAAYDVTLLQLLVAFGRARRATGAATRAAGGPPSARLASLGLGAELTA